MKRTLNAETPKLLGKNVKIQGWVQNKRKMGKMVFLDLRDRTGLLQVICTPELDESDFKIAQELGHEDVVSIEGVVQKRIKENLEMKTGSTELLAKNITVLNKSNTPPFEINKDTLGINEELRLQHRYLDLRTQRMAKNLKLRCAVVNILREFLLRNDFLEVETPLLTKGTPEGAREFIVPSRIYPGKFYVLPQSPQQFKQLLQVAGVEKYFQFARAFRDEDQRGDRQPEFTQLDIEMSFVNQEDVLNLGEEMMNNLIDRMNELAVKGADLNLGNGYRITNRKWPRLTYKESIEKYGTDKPDLRQNKNDSKELAFAWVTDFPMFEKDSEGNIQAAHHPFTMPNPEDEHLLETDPLSVRAWSYDIVLNGYEISSGSIRIHSRDLQNRIFKIMGMAQDEIKSRFGHMLNAFEYGAPPHGGFAPGLDRIVMILANEPNIREVIAFPKTGDAKDLMMDAPSDLPQKSLDSVHIKIKK